MTIEQDSAGGGADSGAVRRTRFGRDAAVTLSTALFSRGSVLILQVGAARLLGVVAFNLFVTASIIGAVVYLLSDLGLRQAVIVAASGDEQLARGALVKLRPARLQSAVAGAALGSLATAAIAGTGPKELAAGVVIVVGYSVQSYARFLRTPLRATAKVVAEARLEWVERAVAFAGAGAGLLTGELILVGAGQAAGALVGVVLARRALRLTSDDRAVGFTRSPLRYGATLSAAVAATMLGSRVDYFILLRMEGQLDAALYAAAYTLILSSSLLHVALADTAFAYLPGKRLSRRFYLGLVGLTGTVSMAGIGLVGPFAVRSLFKLDHPDLVPLCWMLGVAALVMAFTSTIGVFAPIAGQERRLTAISAVAAGVSVVLCLILIPPFGVLGGAIATVANEVAIGIGWLLASRKPAVTESKPPYAFLLSPE